MALGVVVLSAVVSKPGLGIHPLKWYLIQMALLLCCYRNRDEIKALAASMHTHYIEPESIKLRIYGDGRVSRMCVCVCLAFGGPKPCGFYLVLVLFGFP